MRLLKKYFLKLFVIGILGFLAIVAYVHFVVFTAPHDFATQEFIEIPQGSSLSSISKILEDQNIISSEKWFKLALYVLGKEQEIKSGSYYFTSPQDMKEVIRTVINGSYNIPTERVTILEGEAAYEFSATVAKALPLVDEQVFLDLVTSKNKEGYLYPDTYFFPQDATESDVISIMEKNFSKKISPYNDAIKNSQYTLGEILAMASLIENEAGSASFETKKKVAGVLWKRVEIQMPIQADAVFSYIYQEHLPRVLLSHLEVDSPYNLYKQIGLPPGPIGNPSIDSIRAALEPTPSSNLFYLTGFDGTFHYAQTLWRHESNRRQYLNYK